MSGVIVAIALFSVIINLLMLTGSIYMLQVYDRVLSSRSIETLIGISLIVLVAFLVQGMLDAIRQRMLARMGAQLDERLTVRAFEATAALHLRGARNEQSQLPVRDLDQVRTFASGLGPTVFFDAPMMPIFYIGCYLLHPWLGHLAVIGAIVIIGLTLISEQRTKGPTERLTKLAGERQSFLDASRRNAEVIRAMGMGPTFERRWQNVNAAYVDGNLALTDSGGSISTAAKIFRLAFQSAVLGLGAYLVIRQEMTPGGMIAASIMTSRGLAPVELAVSHWKQFVAARQSFHRLNELLGSMAAKPERTELPVARRDLKIDDLAIAIPGRQTPLLAGANVTLKAGSGLMIVGPSGSGKSTLARVLVGVWPAVRGAVRLDGAALDQWDPGQLGEAIGYLPQDTELFDGTIAENIARFLADGDDEKVIAAAKAAGVHDVILTLPQGYATRVGEGGAVLSGGQRQRIGLARALYGQPFLIVLDEPNSNLDTDGELALIQAIMAVRKRGGIVVIISHKLQVLDAVDLVGRVHDGKLQVITRDEYRANLLKQTQAVRGRPAPVAPAAGAAAPDARGGPRPAPAADTAASSAMAPMHPQQQLALLRAATAPERPGPGAPAPPERET
jgi:ATP-binding cassette subfamily C protein